MITRRFLLGVVTTAALLSSGVATTASAAPTPGKTARPATTASPIASPFSSVDQLASWTAGGLIDSDLGSLKAQPLGSASQGGLAQSGSGSGGFAQVGACTFYATSASAGGYCGAGGGGSHPPSLQAWLAGRPFVPCRFFPVPPGMSLNTGEAPGGTWMLKGCFENVDFTQPWGGRNMIVDIYSQWVPNGTQHDIPGYMETLWNYASHENFYPVPRISVGPTQPALVDTYTYFWTSWYKAQDSAAPAKDDYRIPYDTLTAGTVYLHMQVHDVVIYPGVPTMDPVHCGLAKTKFDDNAPDAIPQSEGGSQQSDCWLRYEHSTAFHTDTQTVLIHADAFWRVTIEDAQGHVIRSLGDFDYLAYQRLPVAEVQTLVNW